MKQKSSQHVLEQPVTGTACHWLLLFGDSELSLQHQASLFHPTTEQVWTGALEALLPSTLSTETPVLARAAVHSPTEQTSHYQVVSVLP